MKELCAVVSLGSLCGGNDYSHDWYPGRPSYLLKNGRDIDCETDNHIATEHQTKALGDRKPAQAVGDHERRVETDLPDWLQPFTKGLTSGSSSSTDVSPADESIPLPAIPPSARPSAKPNSFKSGRERHLSTHGTSSVLVQFWTSRKLVNRSCGVLLLSSKCACKTYWQMTRHHMNVGSIHHLKGRFFFPCGTEVIFYPKSSKGQGRVHHFDGKVLP